MIDIGDALADRYQVRAPLGRGGLGEVYVAIDRVTRREVVVKVLDATPPEARTRLTAVLAAASSVEHPVVVVPRLEPGGVDRPSLLISEKIEGEDLAGHIARVGAVPWPRALDLACACAEGLAALAAATGVGHRALKPGNLRITPKGEARVLDFGLAELGVRPAPPRPDGLFAEYRAPEQLTGAAGDERSDVFTLGVLLFEMISGAHPFTGATAFKAMHAVLSRTSAPQLSTSLPSRVEALIARALATKSSERFEGVADLARQLALVRRSPGALPGASPETPPAAAAVLDDRTQRHDRPAEPEDRTTLINLSRPGERAATSSAQPAWWEAAPDPVAPPLLGVSQAPVATSPAPSPSPSAHALERATAEDRAPTPRPDEGLEVERTLVDAESQHSRARRPPPDRTLALGEPQDPRAAQLRPDETLALERTLARPPRPAASVEGTLVDDRTHIATRRPAPAEPTLVLPDADRSAPAPQPPASPKLRRPDDDRTLLVLPGSTARPARVEAASSNHASPGRSGSSLAPIWIVALVAVLAGLVLVILYVAGP